MPDRLFSDWRDAGRVLISLHVVIHIDETRAVEPVECTAHWERRELRETFPRAV
jgi:hypothetical protein